MGGFGSGGWTRWHSKRTVESCHRIVAQDWHRRGWLRPGQRFTLFWPNGEGLAVNVGHEVVWLSPVNHGQTLPWRERVALIWTPCPFGGCRVWFRCPVGSCHRQVAKLYHRGHAWRCRHCHRLSYASQQVARDDRPMHRAHKIQERLGGQPGWAHPFPRKPKGMWWRTYHRWEAKYQAADAACAMTLAQKLGWLGIGM